MGVFVFRADGVFGYKFAVMFDFFDESNLPSAKGHWIVKPDGSIAILMDTGNAPPFRIEWHRKDDSFDILRLEKDGTLPMKAHYIKSNAPPLNRNSLP